MAALAVVGAATSVIASNKSAQAQADAISHQNEVEAEQISKQAGQQLTENAKKAYAERGAMRAAAAESGINLGSGSFIAALQTTALNQYSDQGVAMYNEKANQQERQAQANTAASGLQKDTWASGLLKVTSAGVNAYAGAGGFAKAPSFSTPGTRLPATLAIPQPGSRAA
jgi:hypothetical protein